MVKNEEILEVIKTKLDEKNEVITEQQQQIADLLTKLEGLESKVAELEALESDRASLLDQLRSLD